MSAEKCNGVPRRTRPCTRSGVKRRVDRRKRLPAVGRDRTDALTDQPVGVIAEPEAIVKRIQPLENIGPAVATAQADDDAALGGEIPDVGALDRRRNEQHRRTVAPVALKANARARCTATDGVSRAPQQHCSNKFPRARRVPSSPSCPCAIMSQRQRPADRLAPVANRRCDYRPARGFRITM